MATKKTAKPTARPSVSNRSRDDSYYIPPPTVPSNQTNDDSEMGFLIAFISMVIVFGLLLPLMAMMYLDILETKKETQKQQQQVQRLINQVRKEKDDSNSRNPTE